MRPPIQLSCVLLVATGVARAAASTAVHESVPFVEDDYAAALKKAQAQHVPLFVDAWAPWCHTCLSMRAFVFTDPALAHEAARFVWLAVDTEKPQNAGFLEKFPIRAWPTLLIIDPANEKVALRWLGSATLPELEHLLDDGERSVRGNGTGADALLTQADKLYGSGQARESAQLLQKILNEAPPDWPRRARATESLLGALNETKQHEACVQAARRELPRIPRSAASSNVVESGLLCALASPKDAAWRKGAIAEFESKAREVIGPPVLDMAVDDRSMLYESLADARDDAADEAGRKKVAADWARYLEGEAAKTSTPAARAAFDPQRVEAYIRLGEPARALPMLQQSEKDFPSDYNPPARLCLALTAMGRFDDALAASDRALAKAYGPRKLRVMLQRAETLVAKGDKASARKVLVDAQQLSQSLPAAQVSKGIRQEISSQLAQFGSASR